MFSDLVGSTALSARMDPEDLREVISAYQRCVAETVRRFGGFVARYMGDGVPIDFGYRKLTRLLRRDLSVPADRHTLADTITIPVVDEIGLSMFEAETRHHSGAH